MRIRANTATAQWLLGLTSGALLMVVIGWALVQTSFDAASSSSGNASLNEPVDTFTITGDAVEAIAPGFSVPLDLTISNNYDYPMEVTGITVAVQSINAPHATADFPCTIDDFEINQLISTTAVTLPASTIESLTDLHIARTDLPQIGIRESAHNQDGCKGASLTLAYTASGRLEK